MFSNMLRLKTFDPPSTKQAQMGQLPPSFLNFYCRLCPFTMTLSDDAT